MTERIHIFNTYIVTKITTDNGTIVEPNGQFEIVKFKVNSFEFSYPNQTVKFAVLYQLRIKGGGYKYFIPIVGGISVPNEYFYFMCS